MSAAVFRASVFRASLFLANTAIPKAPTFTTTARLSAMAVPRVSVESSTQAAYEPAQVFRMQVQMAAAPMPDTSSGDKCPVCSLIVNSCNICERGLSVSMVEPASLDDISFRR
jgi:hypothetical protein